MSTLGTFSFGAMTKVKDETWSDKIVNLLSRNNEMINKSSSNMANVRSARPGIPSYDYSPAYTNRMWLSWCYWFEDEVSILADVLQKIRDEVLRYGFKWNPAFAKKCVTCGQEFQDDVDECELCKSKNLREPDKAQLRQCRVDQFNTILDRANLNKQSLQEVLKTTLFHMLVTDNGYLLAHKDYFWGPDGSLRAFPREYFALDPRDVIKLFDFETGYPGKGRVCLDHRSSLCGETDMKCPTCQKPTFRAFYQVFTATKTSTYYIDDEICHLIYYYPGIIYGYPKCLKIKDELISYHMIEKRVRNYYEFCKVPGILFIPTDDPEALQEMWQKVRDGTKDDPFTPAVLGLSETAPTNANFIKMMQDPNAELIAIKEELRMRIASSFEVTIAFTNDTGNSGGLKNDKNMISMADRTIRSIQDHVDKKALRWISISMGITDWKLECEPNINENKLEQEEVRAAQINNAERLSAMGLKVVWKGDTYTVGKGPLMSPEMMMMGMGGGGMPPPPGMPGMSPMGGPPAAPMMPSAGAPMPPPSPGVPMMPDAMGGMSAAPIPPSNDMGVLDAMAAGKGGPAEAAAPASEEDELSQITESMKGALGLGEKPKPTKKKVSTKLSRLIDDMFLSNSEKSKKLKEEEEQEAQGDPMAGGAPPMGGMPPPPGMPGMGPAPMGLDPNAPPSAPPSPPPM